MDQVEQLKNEITELKARNARVEAEKAWETSWARRALVAVLTYLVIVLFFFVSELPDPFTNAVVPTTGFLISTFSMSYFKKVWMGRR